jgi:ornithine--oxo-acid transaminase
MSTSVASTTLAYCQYVNPQWARLLDVLGMNVEYRRCQGIHLTTTEDIVLKDFLSGYCVHNIGHNHPRVVAALVEELERNGPAMLQSHVPQLAGELAARLCQLAGSSLSKVFFASSGSEGIEATIKFARATTGRNGLVAAKGAFHGLTCGALSLMEGSFWSEGFGPLLPDTHQVPFNDLDALETVLRSKKIAAFIVEPVQAEAGIYTPKEDYLIRAQELCRKYGTLFVLDEVQTGMFRTGPFLAFQHWKLDPDMVILAKALSGGLVPVGAVLMTETIYDSVYSSLRRAIIHTSTFGENHLAMRAGLATLDVLLEENLGQNAIERGHQLRAGLRAIAGEYEMIAEIRGIGLLCGIAFQAPHGFLLRSSFEAFRKVHPALFGQMLVRHLFLREHILTQICGNNFMVLKAAPPLNASTADIEQFLHAFANMMKSIHHSTAFWTEALNIARKAVNI